MEIYGTKQAPILFSAPLVCRVGVLCWLVLMIATGTLLAQPSRTISTTGRRLEEFNKVTEKAARDQLERDMTRRKATDEERRRSGLLKLQIKKDFAALQNIYNESVARLHEKAEITPEYAAEVSENLSTLGSRLRDTGIFPEVKSDKQDEISAPSNPRLFLQTICADLYKFLTSPMFETGVLDVAEATVARQTLDRIILFASTAHRKFGKVH